MLFLKNQNKQKNKTVTIWRSSILWKGRSLCQPVSLFILQKGAPAIGHLVTVGCPSDEERLYIAIFALGPGSVDSEAGWPWAQSDSLISTSNSLRGYKAGKCSQLSDWQILRKTYSLELGCSLACSWSRAETTRGMTEEC